MQSQRRFIKIVGIFLVLSALLSVLSCTPKSPKSELQNLSPAEKIVRVKALYLMRCASCHGENGEGRIGPNLSDEYWLNGDSAVESLVTMIAEGQVKKGMPAWKNLFHADDIRELAAYIKTFQGTSPANAKAPQGEKK